MSQNPDKKHIDAWRLFITSHALLIDKIDGELASAGAIPLHWYDVLIELYEAPERRLRMHELAQNVVLSRSGLTRLVDRLEKEEFLRREIDANDRRGFYVILTDRGLEAMRAAWKTYEAGIARYFAAYLNDDEAALFSRVLGRIVEELRKIPT